MLCIMRVLCFTGWTCLAWAMLPALASAQLADAFTTPCEASPVYERPAPIIRTTKGVALYLTTRCTRTGESQFWECLEKAEAGKLLMDCAVQHVDGPPGREVRVVFTTRERLGGTLCSVACRPMPQPQK
ncbi:hypothetical protein [Megalodesulfovibrio gigas]|nr:hypothetical protein [Megalodesulfovibrio gigas]